MRWLFLFAGLSGMFGVVFGAFGAHLLRGKLPEQLMHSFHTAVEYQMYHSIALMMACYLAYQWPESSYLKWSAYLFCAGILFFSGSLYLLSVTGLKLMGPITPVGGVMFILAWLLLSIGIWKNT